ncbi:hypothetical protein L6452_39300 [Arctium lappa]|uniref:Uncharacterized protein n=1 Tax=Arctium lappa TaxID=4217 RepID=A0ACB8XS54_ARCLA|nr:hypothetical protein L6452_39300 [Arctium lappa]
MILHHLTSGILNHKTSIFIFLIKFNVWELGLKSWNGCPRKVSSSKMVLEVLNLRIQVAFKRARWVKSRFSLNLARHMSQSYLMEALGGLSLDSVAWEVSIVTSANGEFLSCSPRCAEPFGEFP